MRNFKAHKQRERDRDGEYFKAHEQRERDKETKPRKNLKDLFEHKSAILTYGVWICRLLNILKMAKYSEVSNLHVYCELP